MRPDRRLPQEIREFPDPAASRKRTRVRSVGSQIGCQIWDAAERKSHRLSGSNRSSGPEVSMRDFGGRFAHRRFPALSSTIFETSSRRRASTVAVCGSTVRYISRA